MGKTLDIDENTRFITDYVRVRIACMDVNKVPGSARCAMGCSYMFSPLKGRWKWKKVKEPLKVAL